MEASPSPNIEEGGAPEVLPIAEELGNLWLLHEGGSVFRMQSLIGDPFSDRSILVRILTNAK